MDDLSAHLRTVTRITFLFLSVCFIGWALLPEYKPLFGGLVIGAAGSLINARHLAWKVNRVGANAAEQGTRRVNLGFLTRGCVALLAVVVSTETLSFSLAATVAGLFTAQLATLVLGFLSRVKPVSPDPTDERGENN
jgi:ATP synthase protein I